MNSVKNEITLFVPWKPKSPNQIKGVKDKIRNWKRARTEWRTALALSFFQDEQWTRMITCHSLANPLPTLLRKVSDATTRTSNGSTAKPERPASKGS